MLQPIKDLRLEKELWFDHNPVDGSQIGGAMPKEYTLVQDLPGAPDSLMLSVSGGAYATAEASTARPDFTAAGFPYATMTATFTIDDKADEHIIEFDLIRTVLMPDGTVWRFNGSLQINVDEGWMVQIDENADSKGGWIDTGVRIPALTPNVPHTISTIHHTDMAAKTHTVLGIIVDGVTYMFPPAAGVPAALTTWAKNLAVPQIQITLNKNGGSFTVFVTGISILQGMTL